MKPLGNHLGSGVHLPCILYDMETHIDPSIRSCILTSTHTCTHTPSHPRNYTFMRPRVQYVCACMHAYTDTHPHIHSCMHEGIHACYGQILHARNRHLRNHCGLQLHFSMNFQSQFPMDLHFFSGISQGVVTFPVDFHWKPPADLHLGEFWCEVFCPHVRSPPPAPLQLGRARRRRREPRRGLRRNK